MPPFRAKLAALAERHGERLLHTPNNTISMAITLSSEAGGRPPTAMGASLFVRLISGCRIVVRHASPNPTPTPTLPLPLTLTLTLPVHPYPSSPPGALIQA